MEILDPVLIAEFAAIVSGGVQAVKNRPRLRNVDGEVLAAAVGVIVGVGWFVISGRVFGADAPLGVDWIEVARGLTNGCAAGLSASGVFNLQTLLPIPNLLPTRTEKSTTQNAPAQAEGDV